jgi:outer membrane protein assembly factor BamE
MPASPRHLCLAAWVLAAGALSGCASLGGVTQRTVDALTPYRAQVVQGNFVSREQAQALQPGMLRQQVRDILGTPLVASVFHADRWDYVFTLRRQGVPAQSHRLTVFFDGDRLQRVEAGDLPTEAEFVALLDAPRRSGARVPALQATPEQLERFRPPPAAAGHSTAAPPPLPSPDSYPPLEPPLR